MELFQFGRGLLAWMVTITALFPVNIFLLALAYKVQQGPASIRMERKEFWLRCAGGALVVTMASLVAVWLDHWLAVSAEYPAGPVHLVILALLVMAGVWTFFVFLALEDLFQGLSLFLLYVFLPVFVLFVVNQVVGLWDPLLNLVNGWLKQPI